ncbi:MAG: HPr family phosphocarrier protein [Clostridiales bacterium]|nr:HPr family phosphocarrier protein [Clostridiales bacterium]
MKEMYLKFHRVEDILNFVSIVSKYPYPVDLICGRFGADGKSLLGVLAIGLDKEIKVQIQADDAELLGHELERYEILAVR